MSKFVETAIDLGEVKPGQLVKPFFKLKEDVKIVNFSVTCNCIKPRVDKRGGVRIEHTVADIPYHLVQNGLSKLPRDKVAQVMFEDGTQEELKFKFIIVK